MNIRKKLPMYSVVALLLVCGCGGAKEWSLEPIASVKGFKTPECAEVSPVDGTVYVANLHALSRTTVGALDSNGFISTLAPGGKLTEYESIKGTPELPIHGAAGMCFFKGYLYFNDRNGLKRRKLDGSGPVEAVSVPGSKSFNDAGCDDNYVYMTGENSIYRVDAEGKSDKFLTLKGVNGIKSFKGKLFAVTTAKDESDVYELDPAGKEAPKPFGLAPKFKGIDGIVVLPDGTFIITDCHGHKVYSIGPDRKTVKLLAEGLEYPADLDVDFERRLVYVPQFFRGTVEVYRLKATDK
jgi:DNA-binding beta-propeller fold protein YncE